MNIKKYATRKTAIIAAAVAVFSGGSAGTALALTSGGDSITTSPASTMAVTVRQVAFITGATGVSMISPTLYASSEGLATRDGRQVDIAVFANDSLRDSWVKIASQYGPILDEGDDWAIFGD